MAQILSKHDQEAHLGYLVEVTLNNFVLASRLGDVLFQHQFLGAIPPAAVVHLKSALLECSIPGTNCGFVSTPVIMMALIDCRRSLEFFGLSCDIQGVVSALKGTRRPDDIGVEHFGLAWIEPAQLFDVASSALPFTPKDPQSLFAEVHKYSNKEIAHFTKAHPVLDTRTIVKISTVMIEVYFKLLWDALKRPRPTLNAWPTP